MKWVDEVAKRTKPERVVWCDGSDEEFRSFVTQMLHDGTLIELDQGKMAGCYLHRSDPRDVARTEASTFICTASNDDVGPTNNWMDKTAAEKLLWTIFDGCMKGRTMFAVLYLLGPAYSPYSQVGVELTDSLYVTVSLRIMTRMGAVALGRLKRDGGKGLVRGIHSKGTSDPKLRYICHFPDQMLSMSINSNYGGNALLPKKSHSLRLASVIARKEGWLAEHMLVIGIQDAHSGSVTYLTGAFPSASGKTNLAMLEPAPAIGSRFKVLTIGDDIAWLHLGSDGMLHAINPEAGFFCVAPGTSDRTNPNLMRTINRNTIFTNVALTEAQLPWWEGQPAPEGGVTDWQGRPWKPGGSEPAAHPNSRLTVSMFQCPNLSSRVEDPDGVPISAILFGGRRAELIPLVYEALSWSHGVLIGAMMKVETTAAAEGAIGRVRNDPMAMSPFCGYNMGEYFSHWLDFEKRSTHLPRIFQVNWFRKGGDGRFLWPGFGDNIRVLKWIVERINGDAEAVETPIGYVPAPGSLDLEGLDISQATMDALLSVNKEGWRKELESSNEFFKTFGERFPERLREEYRELMDRLG